MNSVLEGSFQNFTISDDLAREHNLIRDAESHTCEQHPKGYFHFIRLKLLNHRLAADQIHRFKFIWTVDVFYGTRGMTGSTISEFAEKHGCLTFRYDPMLRAHAAYMFDDHQPALYAEKGQNRDFLASHYAEGDFEIDDESVLLDVQARVKVLNSIQESSQPKETDHPGLTQSQVEDMNEQSLNEELVRIEDMKRRIMDQKSKIAPRETIQEPRQKEVLLPQPARQGRKARVPLATEA